MYQDPNFDKKAYAEKRKREKFLAANNMPPEKSPVKCPNNAYVGNKPVSKKALLKNTKRARKAQNVS